MFSGLLWVLPTGACFLAGPARRPGLEVSCRPAFTVAGTPPSRAGLDRWGARGSDPPRDPPPGWRRGLLFPQADRQWTGLARRRGLGGWARGPRLLPQRRPPPLLDPRGPARSSLVLLDRGAPDIRSHWTHDSDAASAARRVFVLCSFHHPPERGMIKEHSVDPVLSARSHVVAEKWPGRGRGEVAVVRSGGEDPVSPS